MVEKMFGNISLFLAALATGTFLGGCGGGGGHHGGGEGEGGEGTGSGVSTYQGQFIDAHVQGLSYVARPSGLNGTTDAAGTFQFEAGDTVTFSLSVGNSNVLQLGSIAPVVSSDGAALLFVLCMENGLTIAQVLQSLNHGTGGAMDVSGLSLAAADVTALSNYIGSGGLILPEGDATDLQMLAQAQSDSNLPASDFVDQGGASITATLTALDVAVLQLPVESSIDLSTLLPGKLEFSQLFVSGSGTPGLTSGIGYIGADGSKVSVNQNSATNPTTQPYTISGNVVSFPGSGVSDTVVYIDSLEGLWILSNSQASVAGYSLFLQQTLTQAMIAGKVLVFAGSIDEDCPGDVPLQIMVDSAGTGYGVTCSGPITAPSPGAQLIGGKIDSVSSMPGVLSLTDASGAVYYLGLQSGTLETAAMMAVVETNVPTGATPIEGVFQVGLSQ